MTVTWVYYAKSVETIYIYIYIYIFATLSLWEIYNKLLKNRTHHDLVIIVELSTCILLFVGENTHAMVLDLVKLNSYACYVVYVVNLP